MDTRECEKVSTETHVKGKTVIRSSCRWHGGSFETDQEWNEHVMSHKLAWLGTKFTVRVA